MLEYVYFIINDIKEDEEGTNYNETVKLIKRDIIDYLDLLYFSNLDNNQFFKMGILFLFFRDQFCATITDLSLISVSTLNCS